MAYGYTQGYSGLTRGRIVPSAGGGPLTQVASTVDFSPESTQGAALSVAVMLVASVLFLAVLKKSGLRAMVAVGHGG